MEHMVLYAVETWTLLRAFEMWIWLRTDRVIWKYIADILQRVNETKQYTQVGWHVLRNDSFLSDILKGN